MFVTNSLKFRFRSELQKMNNMEKLMNIKILRPITIPIVGILLIMYIIIAYIFDLEM